MLAILQLKIDGGKPSIIEIETASTLTIGRVSSNRVQIQDNLVSRSHAVIDASEFGLVYSDLGSLNGSYLNNIRIQSSASLEVGDVVGLGKATIKVTSIGELVSGAEELLKTQTADLKTTPVSLLLADVKHYTEMSRVLPFADVSGLLTSWFEDVSLVVTKNGGQVDKLIGDCLMAFWPGSSGEEEALAKRAYLSALEIRELTQSFAENKNWPHLKRYSWECTTVINSGEVHMGGVGMKDNRSFTILGDTVNSTFRLEDFASSTDLPLILGAETARLLEGSYEFVDVNTELAEFGLKNISAFQPS